MAASSQPASVPGPGWYGVDPLEHDGQQDDPYPALRRLREQAPVNETPLGYWRLSRYEDCVRLLREVPTGVRLRDGSLPVRGGGNPAGPGEFMLQQDPPTHTRLRKLVSKAFTPRSTERWRPRVQEITDALLEPKLGEGRMDVIADLALPVPATLICEMLGVPVADRDRFTRWTAHATWALARNLASAEQWARAEAATLALAEYFQALIEERRGSLRDDLLSVLIRAEEDGERLSASELLVQSIGLLIAGFETTIGLIGNGVAALIRHPSELEKLHREPAIIVNAVEECLRYDGPIPATPRTLHADAKFGGQLIRRDTEVVAMLRSANRDPERFPDPDRLDVARANAAEHLAFGGGAHHCLGAHLARMESQVAIGSLVQRTRGLALVEDRVTWGESLFRVPGRLPIAFQPA